MLQNISTPVPDSSAADLLTALRELGADADANGRALLTTDATTTAALALIDQYKRLYDLQSAFCDTLLADIARLKAVQS
jgi:hypothetical protein